MPRDIGSKINGPGCPQLLRQLDEAERHSMLPRHPTIFIQQPIDGRFGSLDRGIARLVGWPGRRHPNFGTFRLFRIDNPPPHAIVIVGDRVLDSAVFADGRHGGDSSAAQNLFRQMFGTKSDSNCALYGRIDRHRHAAHPDTDTSFAPGPAIAGSRAPAQGKADGRATFPALIFFMNSTAIPNGVYMPSGHTTPEAKPYGRSDDPTVR